MKNLDKYLGALQEYGVDGLLLTSRVNRLYAAEYDIAEGVSIVTAKGCRYFTDSRYIESAQNGIKGYEVLMVSSDREKSYNALINQAIDDFGIKTLGFEEDYMTVGEYNLYSENLHVTLKPCQQLASGFRGVKEPWEIDRMIRAQEIADKTMAEIFPLIHEGMTEKELAAEIIYGFYRNGADNLSFDPIVVSGPNTSMPHGVPSDRRIQKGDFITMDVGVMLDGYCSDMTRTVALGYATDEMKKVYETVLEAQLAGIAATKAGVPGKDVDGAARKVITDAGYGAYFGHGYGHSLGLEIHENPGANTRAVTPLPAGAVVSAEPGIYLPGKFGVRIEDVVVVTEDGCYNITKTPKDLIIL
jgi:Xaa-Pro aminopeptidase